MTAHIRARGFVVLFHRFHQLRAVSKLMKITPTSIKMLYFIFRIHFFKIVDVWRLEYVEGREYLETPQRVKACPSHKPRPFQPVGLHVPAQLAVLCPTQLAVLCPAQTDGHGLPRA